MDTSLTDKAAFTELRELSLTVEKYFDEVIRGAPATPSTWKWPASMDDVRHASSCWTSNQCTPTTDEHRDAVLHRDAA